LPRQYLDVHQFTDQAAVMQGPLDYAPGFGIFYSPGDEAASTPTTFVNVLKLGYQVGIERMMIAGLVKKRSNRTDRRKFISTNLRLEV
jgi:hypothetical protein